MTTEDDFQTALDANPDDWQTRLVFADWLDERGDPRGPGYRALGLLRLVPHRSESTGLWVWWNGAYCPKPKHLFSSTLPDLWYREMGRQGRYRHSRRKSRRNAENDGARAFAKLSPDRRAELLSLPVLVGDGS